MISQNFNLSNYAKTETTSFFPLSPSSRLIVTVQGSGISMDSSNVNYTDTVATSSDIKIGKTAAVKLTRSSAQSLSTFIREGSSPTPVLHSARESRFNRSKD